MNASAVSDAIRNAEINGIKNCRFVCSKVRFRIFVLSLIVKMPEVSCDIDVTKTNLY